MPAQNKFEDTELIKKVTQANVEMLVTMHTGLSEIARCEASPGGVEAMKFIAAQSLRRVQEIADRMEVR